MTDKMKDSTNSRNSVSQIEVDLLATLLEPEDNTYPWNLYEENTQAYFNQLEEQFPMQALLDEELDTRCEAFHNQLDALWSKVETSAHYNCNTNQAVAVKLQKNLQKEFCNSMPKDWINLIAQKAAEIFNAKQSITEQLIECVQAVLPSLEVDDIMVLARPLAYATRSGSHTKVESTLANYNQEDNREWAALSEIEQAKVGLAIAYHALNQLNSFQAEE
ncbi:hypothetical protein IQ247_08590 [Plectonema cf. radiosum LEGE 06105]|uniref:Uncharacterized protein n=1 Tax=Plectonema cf. radiosum LEGE 06105 TaxID=945769 RepID=A0A8J7F2N7_9CYAN|nr:hypothetical protein [Plectonema radiosum]MBE9212748.1 hypothetical protein [Plectonema cf. radiosum LEGE 06105]